MSLIIDCHGHYTVLPKGHDAWREEQKAAFAEGRPAPPYPDITDDERNKDHPQAPSANVIICMERDTYSRLHS